MNNRQTAIAFLNGKTTARKAGWQMNIQDGKLFSYGQVIGEHNDDGSVTVHTSKYGSFSSTTSRHISILQEECGGRRLVVREA